MKMIQTMKSGSASRTPRPPRPKITTRLTTIAATTMITTSSRKAAARVPASASLTLRSTPSGVINGLISAAGVLAVTMTHHPEQVEIGDPQRQHAAANGVASRIAGDRLPADAFEQADNQEHHHD